MATRLVATNPRRRLSRQQWERAEQVALDPVPDLKALTLDWVDDSVRDLDALGALVGISIERTIEGGSTVTVTLRDRGGELFAGQRVTQRARRGPAPDVIGRAVDLELDGVVFRLVKVRASSASGELELTFEDRIVYLLKRQRGRRRAASRADVTRAEFILSLLREVETGRYRFVCPELHKRQPIDSRSHGAGARARWARSAGSASADTGSEDPETRGGFADNAKITVKGGAATREQRRNLDGVLTECRAQNASENVMVATVCCVTQESVAKRLSHGDVAGPDSRGLFQQRSPWGPVEARMDPRQSTRMFLTGGKGGQPGWKQKHGSVKRVPGSIESAVTAVQVSVGHYGQWEAEARRTVQAWHGSDGGDAGGRGSYVRPFQYTRQADENSWEAMRRLAEEVDWRLFVVGNSVCYMSETQLYARRARYEVTPDDPAVLDVSYDVDWGRPVNELTLSVSLERWGAPPGTIITVNGFGPPDGRWLVSSVQRDYFSVIADVTCKQPAKADPEPAHETVQRSGDDEGSAGGSAGTRATRLYRECKRISDGRSPYLWGGGHGSLRSIADGAGLDCSGAVSLALHRAGMFNGSTGMTSGALAQSWGRPGPGDEFTVWANSGHVFIEFSGVGHAKRFDTSPHGCGERGPQLRPCSRPTTGFTARHWPKA